MSEYRIISVVKPEDFRKAEIGDIVVVGADRFYKNADNNIAPILVRDEKLGFIFTDYSYSSHKLLKRLYRKYLDGSGLHNVPFIMKMVKGIKIPENGPIDSIYLMRQLLDMGYYYEHLAEEMFHMEMPDEY